MNFLRRFSGAYDPVNKFITLSNQDSVDTQQRVAVDFHCDNLVMLIKRSETVPIKFLLSHNTKAGFDANHFLLSKPVPTVGLKLQTTTTKKNM